MLEVSIHSIISDIFLFVPVYSGHKNGHSRNEGLELADVLFPRSWPVTRTS
jgi:hypothetical protein